MFPPVLANAERLQPGCAGFLAPSLPSRLTQNGYNRGVHVPLIALPATPGQRRTATAGVCMSPDHPPSRPGLMKNGYRRGVLAPLTAFPPVPDNAERL